jgi:hypothetical protein
LYGPWPLRLGITPLSLSLMYVATFRRISTFFGLPWGS